MAIGEPGFMTIEHPDESSQDLMFAERSLG